MSVELLNEHKLIWEEKPVLRAVYHNYYQRILEHTKEGLSLEVGGGSGNLKNYLDKVVSTDILEMPWLDTICDAQKLPFQKESFDNIVVIDVLHHIENVSLFFSEVERVLKNRGRLILLEPAITKISWFFYHFLHPEPVILNNNPLKTVNPDPNRKPFDANQAIPELLFGKFQNDFVQTFPNLALQHKSYLSLWVYPLSGGFRKWCLVPKRFVPNLLALESIIEPSIGKHIGFRMMVVIEKTIK